MKAAVEILDFEEAARLRDLILNIKGEGAKVWKR
jgi:excinuclease UvrABC nuclease subunit